MFPRAWFVVAVLVAATPRVAAESPTGNTINGRALYNTRCASCHSQAGDQIGPDIFGIVNRKPASVPGYAYSPALKRLKTPWTRALLDRWLKDSQTVAPGSAMYFAVPNAAQRHALIDYLATQPNAQPTQKHVPAQQ